MKSSYELAMERLNKSAPSVKLTEEQKKKISELEGKYAAKVAEREIFVKDEIASAVDKGKYEDVEMLKKQLISDRKSLQAELEEKKKEVREKT